ncbi:MAG: polyprenyl synthetase family protein [Planctomycetes bacterium]|nr:polyprenyl synthetase family protein [Planctomycetota bacterium]
MSSTAALHDLLALVRPELQRMNQELARELRPTTAELQPLLDHVVGFAGKQLRPALVFLTARVFSEVVDEALYTCAKVVELIHTATLLHDDVLDGAVIRRRLPTLNALHGNEVPVLLGDHLYALAFHLAVGLDDVTCARELSAAVREVCHGEICQCLARGDTALDEERYLQVIGDKTASLYAAACRVGAHYAGAAPAAVEALANFGRSVGVAFQIIDDCLDLGGDEVVVGKSLGSDLGLGKMTLPLIHLLATAGARRERLVELVGAAGEGAPGAAELRAEFDVDGALRYSLDRARQLVLDGMAALKALPEGPARDALAGVAEYVLRREC